MTSPCPKQIVTPSIGSAGHSFSGVFCSMVACRPWRFSACAATRANGQRVTKALTSDERARMKALERENRELRQANETLRNASAYSAQAELDRRFKP